MSSIKQLVQENQKEELIKALSEGADVNQKDKSVNTIQTALHFSCYKSNIDILKTLLEHRYINVNLEDKTGWSAIHVACNFGAYKSVLEMLKDPRVDVNIVDPIGWSALICASYSGEAEVVKLLISFGRNVDVEIKTTFEDSGTGTKKGCTALDIARQRNKTNVVSVLEQYQLNPLETRNTLRKQLELEGKERWIL